MPIEKLRLLCPASYDLDTASMHSLELLRRPEHHDLALYSLC